MANMKQQDTVNFRVNIAKLCAEHGEIKNVSTKASITRVYLSRIIHGHATPTIDIASRLANAVDLPLSDLFVSRKEFSKIIAKSA